MPSYFRDADFQEELLKCLVKDRNFLQTCSHLLSPDDFKSQTSGEGRERQAIATIALDFWNRYRDPVGKLLRAEAMEWSERAGWGKQERKRIEWLVSRMLSKNGSVGPQLVEKKVLEYKQERKIEQAMEEMLSLLQSNTLSPGRFLEIARKAAEVETNGFGPKEFFTTEALTQRILRRQLQGRRQRFPVFLIEPLDRLVKGPGRKHLGLIIAPYARGKSLCLIWLALAYVLQAWNVLYVTLEDVGQDVEDRFDAAVTSLQISKLREEEIQLRQKFGRFKNFLRARLKILDGTSMENRMTVPAIENMWEHEREKGFTADAIIIDYDDELKGTQKYTERRYEFAEIYQQLRSLAGRRQVLVWTASQTGRGTEELKIIRGKKVAEDIGKMRKATVVLSLGQGEWESDESIYIWVEKHRLDRQHLGCNVLSDKKRGVFYDRERTLARMQEEVK